MQQPIQPKKVRSNKVITQEWRTKGPIPNASEPLNTSSSETQQQVVTNLEAEVHRRAIQTPKPKESNTHQNLEPVAEKQDDKGKQYKVKSRKGDIDFLLTVVYGYNGIEQRRALWELPWKGDYYTWTNKQPGVDRANSRLDRVFGNYEWMMSWGHVETNYGLPQISDYAPMLLTLSSSTWTGRVPFSFFNIWAAHGDFSQIVANIWNSHNTCGTLKSVWTKLKVLKPALKPLNSREFSGITQRIEKARLELKTIQEQISITCTDALLDMEKEILLNLEKWSLIEESDLQQKARTRWIQLGDSNSKYFTAVMKDRTQRKQNTEITTLLGDKLTDPATMEKEIIDLYKSLMGSVANSLPAINRLYMKNGPTLSHQQRMDLCAEFSSKKAWGIINNRITEAIKEFFSTGKIYKAINCSTITLVPKVTKPAIVKEYRPIACCSALYKMISKILASRLQKVMPTIIFEA
ncbi:PREDICTED: uncharacterized protein LOC109231512 [Nicotiana attenuata]|uniref:uncharacterized protein LOC109231512 n=1 Tax=Nicotiana attenuata TaxID=49451 RepID=UPI000905C78B|nr:PREDICTED: uncharacterized protein LOC109231512 [Nicotiana attenuata]